MTEWENVPQNHIENLKVSCTIVQRALHAHINLWVNLVFLCCLCHWNIHKADAYFFPFQMLQLECTIFLCLLVWFLYIKRQSITCFFLLLEHTFWFPFYFIWMNGHRIFSFFLLLYVPQCCFSAYMHCSTSSVHNAQALFKKNQSRWV